MRKNSPRKWLHACLDLLPVILIPVFMVYSHRHDVTENVQVNYKYQSNEVNTFDDLVEGNIYEFNTLLNARDVEICNCSYIIGYRGENDENLIEISIDDYNVNVVLNFYYNANNVPQVRVFYNNTLFNTYTLSNYHNFLLVYLSNFNNDYISQIHYTDYNVIESVDTENTNVMDSFMNKFNNTIDTHFNMGNVFNLTGVYDWFNTNIFNGNAPQIIYSVWNIALYELVMDLLFLLYGLFMWFIDMVQHLMDKPFKSIK